MHGGGGGGSFKSCLALKSTLPKKFISETGVIHVIHAENWAYKAFHTHTPTMEKIQRRAISIMSDVYLACLILQEPAGQLA